MSSTSQKISIFVLFLSVFFSIKIRPSMFLSLASYSVGEVSEPLPCPVIAFRSKEGMQKRDAVPIVGDHRENCNSYGQKGEH
jgi:hypothetical protein